MFTQNLRDVNRCGLQKNIFAPAPGRPPARRIASSALDPEHSITVGGFEQKRKLHAQLLRAPGEVENLLRFFRDKLQLSLQPLERLQQSVVFSPMFFQEFAAVLKSEPALALWYERKEKLCALEQTARGRMHPGRERSL